VTSKTTSGPPLRGNAATLPAGAGECNSTDLTIRDGHGMQGMNSPLSATWHLGLADKEVSLLEADRG
jgi:hypothetical protein